MATEPAFVFLCEQGWEATLSDELNREFPGCKPRQVADGLVNVVIGPSMRSKIPTVALASQGLPNAVGIEAKSISDWSRMAAMRIVDELCVYTGPWRLHVFGAGSQDARVSSRRASLVEAGIIKILRKKQRRLLRSLRTVDGAPVDDEAIAQVALVTPQSGYLSICLPDVRRLLRRCVSPFSAGVVEVPADRKAPSRAFAKLVEAEIRLGRRISSGESCVDLGSSPGSWSYVALKRGARVIAVDRSPLRGDLMNQPNLTFVRGDAFRFVPVKPVDWLLCDVIAFPERIRALLEGWLSERWCRTFCVTIKFRGRDEFALLEPFKSMLEASGFEFLLRRLTNNKNEATAFGARE
jgi:23S rRNA (cytidine2498-2'-O)-methyltransferase